MSLEQYYTEERIGERLISMLPPISPQHCVELSAGEGALLLPVVRIWPEVRISTCELDPENVKKLSSSFKGEHYNIDVLSEDFDSIFEGRFSSFDFAVSNPPFSWRAISKYDAAILEKFNLSDVFSGKRIRSEVLFILQYLRLMARSSYMAFILPELMVCSSVLGRFRSKLLEFCSVVSVSEVEVGAFKGTEAKTYIVIFKQEAGVGEFTYTDVTGKAVIKRPEDFCSGLNELPPSLPSGCDDRFTVKRGNLSGKECRSLGLPYYHTSGFFKSADGVIPMPLESAVILGKKPVVACKGDVLVGRVGSRVVGRAVLSDGEYIVSDCVFRVRFSNPIDSNNFLKHWLDNCYLKVASQARGTCAKYITAQDLGSYIREFIDQHGQKSMLASC